MSEETKKYLILTNDTASKLEDEVNHLNKRGYKLHTLTAISVKGEHIIMPHYIAAMSLPSSGNYDNIEDLKDLHPSEVAVYLANGWIVADSYSKFIRMVKKNERS